MKSGWRFPVRSRFMLERVYTVNRRLPRVELAFCRARRSKFSCARRICPYACKMYSTKNVPTPQVARVSVSATFRCPAPAAHPCAPLGFELCVFSCWKHTHSAVAPVVASVVLTYTHAKSFLNVFRQLSFIIARYLSLALFFTPGCMT